MAISESGSEGGFLASGDVTSWSSSPSLSRAVCHQSGMERSSCSMIGISGCSPGEEGVWVGVEDEGGGDGSGGVGVGRSNVAGVVVSERSLAVGRTVMESAICSWIGCLLTTIVCSSSRSGVTSEARSGSVNGFFESSLMAPLAAARSRASASRGSQSYDSRVR